LKIMLDKLVCDRPKPEPAAIEKHAAWYLDALRKYGLADWPEKQARDLATYCAHVKMHYDAGTKPPKCLLLIGNYGTGKTTAARIVAGLFEWSFYESEQLALEYAANGDKWLLDWLQSHRKTALVIDDAGSEPEAKHYGAVYPAGTVLALRYSVWQSYRTLTVITGNILKDERARMYSGRGADRMAEMFGEIKCVWDSYRRQGQ
jgi:energy-coupling factor transporter ATP-binding protein EcfA2